MPRLPIRTLLLASLLLCAGDTARPGGGFTIPGWLPSLEEAKKVARQTGKPIFLVFRCVP